MYMNDKEIQQIERFFCCKEVNSNGLNLYLRELCSFNIYSNNKEIIALLSNYILPHMENSQKITETPIVPENWDIYFLYLDFNEVCFAKMQTYHSNKYSLIFESSGGITLTNWFLKKRWHVSFENKHILNNVQDIYCGIRRIVMRNLYTYKAALLHAACINWKNKTILICGNKGAGKSTLMYYLIFNYRASIISGDQTIVWCNNDNRMLCWGSIASLKFNSKDWNFFQNSHKSRIVKRFFETHNYFSSNNKLTISPLEFSNIINCEFISIGTPDIVLYINQSQKNSCFEKLSPKFAVKILTSCLIDDVTADKPENNKQHSVRVNSEKNAVKCIAENCDVYSIKSKIQLSSIVHFLDSIIS